ncbi:hypothetical protein ACVWXO_005008 [Bradyrhizobium sp. LM2.7]
MKLEDAFPSKYLKATDLRGRAIIVEIENAPCESLKGLDGTAQSKTVLHFKGKEKALPLNRTNFAAGRESDRRTGQRGLARAQDRVVSNDDLDEGRRNRMHQGSSSFDQGGNACT